MPELPCYKCVVTDNFTLSFLSILCIFQAPLSRSLLIWVSWKDNNNNNNNKLIFYEEASNHLVVVFRRVL